MCNTNIFVCISDTCDQIFNNRLPKDPKKLAEINSKLDKLNAYESAVSEYEEALTHRLYFSDAANESYWSSLRGISLENETAVFFTD